MKMRVRVICVLVALALCVVCTVAVGESKRPHTRALTPAEHITHWRTRAHAARKAKHSISPAGTRASSPLTMADVMERLKASFHTDDSPSHTTSSSPIHSLLAEHEEKTRTRRAQDTCAGTVPSPDAHDHSFSEGEGGLSLTWLGAPKGEMFVVCSVPLAAKKTNVYFSTNYGVDFTDPVGIDAPIIDVYVGAEDENKNVWIYALPLEVSSSYFFLSKDSGRTFSKVTSPVHLTNMIPHESRPSWFLGMVEDTSTAVATDTVYLCEDSDARAPSFRLLKSRVFWTEWLAVADETVDSKDTVFMTRFEGAVTESLAGLDLIRWEYPFTEREDVVVKRNCYDFEQIRQFLFTTELPKDNGFNERALYVSTDEGHTFRRAEFPFSGRENHFKIIDASEDMVFAVVQHTFTRNEGSVFYVEVNSPSSMMINITASKATFSPTNSGRTTPLLVVLETQNPTGCTQSGGISANVKGKVVMVNRGSCHFIEKAINAENRGAAGIIIVSDSEEIFRMHASADKERPSIPTYLIRKSDGEKLRKAILKGDQVKISFIEDNVREVKLWQASHLYASDSTGTKFSVVLKDVMYEAASRDSNTGYIYPETADVFKVQSQAGTYIANQFISAENRLISLITYNKGSLWAPLPSPEGSVCSEASSSDCNLHLALELSEAINDIPLPVSTEEGPGIIVANGFIGRGVGANPFESSVFVSRDGGFTWSVAKKTDGMLLEGPHSFRLLDHGGVIVAVSTGFTEIVHYSVDEGRKFYDFSVAASSGNQPDDDDGGWSGESLQITSEPGGASLVLYVYYGDALSGKWIGKQLSFQSVLDRPCNRDESDYEVWYPGRMSGDEDDAKICILGQHLAYRRRKPCNICYNGLDHEKEFEDFEKDSDRHFCACTRADYICAPGFFRPDPTDPLSECTFDYDSSVSIQCSSSQSSKKVVHYRLVPGDVCTPSEESSSSYDVPLPTKCTSVAGLSAGARFFVSIAVLGAIVLLISGFLWWSPTARKRLIRVLGVGEDNWCGRLGSSLASCSCFRKSTTFTYSKLALDEEGGDLESEDDELLFGLEDAQAKP